MDNYFEFIRSWLSLGFKPLTELTMTYQKDSLRLDVIRNDHAHYYTIFIDHKRVISIAYENLTLKYCQKILTHHQEAIDCSLQKQLNKYLTLLERF